MFSHINIYKYSESCDQELSESEKKVKNQFIFRLYVFKMTFNTRIIF